MKRELSLQHLKTQLRAAAWVPLIFIGITFLGAVAVLMQNERSKELEYNLSAISDLMHYQKMLIAQEVYMNKPQAIEMRLSELTDRWEQRSPLSRFCIQVELHHLPGVHNIISRCTKSADLHSLEAPSERIPITVGVEKVAEISYSLSRPIRFIDLFPPLLILVVLVALGAAVAGHHLLVASVEKVILAPLLSKISEDERKTAMVETARMMAHDIRKPFQLLRVSLSHLMLSKNSEIRESIAPIAKEVEANADSVSSMVRDILEVGKNLELETQSVSIAEIVERACHAISRLHPESTGKFELKYLRRHRIVGDRDKLERAVTNLLENAVQAGAQRIRITTKEVTQDNQTWVTLSVWNDGPAIPEDAATRLFTPFFTNRTGGTGLGLNIVKRITEAHGGNVAATSSASDGTEFLIRLPANRKLVTTDKTNMTATKPTSVDSPPRVLIFDDEALVREHWQQELQSFKGLEIFTFSSWEDFVARDGFALAESAIAFVDIRYKGSRFSGLDIAKSLRRLNPRKIYAITSDTEAASESGLFEAVFGKEVPDNIQWLVA